MKEGLASQASGLAAKTGDLATQAAGQVDELVRQLNEALPKLQAVGFSVEDVSIKMAVPPEFAARIIGKVEALDEARLGEMAKAAGDNKLLASLFEALKTAAGFKKKIAVVFKGVKLDVKLGLLPSIHVALLN